MDNIVEIPLDAPEAQQVATEAQSLPPEAQPEVAEVKRGRGRPKGAPNKLKKPAPREPTPEPILPSPPKVKARRKPVEQKAVKKKPVYESSDSEGAPDARKTTQQIASEVLELLSFQRANQRAQRRDRYAAWFQ